MTNTETDLKPEPKCRWCNGDLLISKDLESVIHPNHLLWSACCTNEDCAFSYKETRGYDRKTDLLADLTRATPDHGLDKVEALEPTHWQPLPAAPKPDETSNG